MSTSVSHECWNQYKDQTNLVWNRGQTDRLGSGKVQRLQERRQLGRDGTTSGAEKTALVDLGIKTFSSRWDLTDEKEASAYLGESRGGGGDRKSVV